MQYCTAFLLLVLATPIPAFAQSSSLSDTLANTPSSRTERIILPGSGADDADRIRQLTGEAPARGYLLRSSSSHGARDATRPDSWRIRPRLIHPQVDLRWNSEIPSSMNNGGKWAGRGLSGRVVSGAAAVAGPLELVLAPEIVYAQNRDFEFVQIRDPSRSSMLPPWRVGGTSADLPLRFGTESFTTLSPGESSLTLSAGPMALGAATESQWWGPGIRNALVLSSNAPGIPHLFVRTRQPLPTWLGAVEAKLLAGTLTESLFFDSDDSNDYRFLSAFAITLQPTREPGLTLGFARAVYGNMDRPARLGGHALDVLLRWDQRGEPDDSVTQDATEQILSFFGRWILPAEGLEVYGEWARTELPTSLRDLLIAPHHSQGYTFGAQWLSPPHELGRVRVQGELTNLESTEKVGGRPTRRFYTGPHVPQGYTHRGQVIGAAIGPGTSSQWLAADYLRPAARVGLFFNRIRWDEDGYYTQPTRDRHLAHDVSMVFGLRGGLRLGRSEINAELARDHRINYLFQNEAYWFDEEQGIDVTNYSFRIGITPWVSR